MISDKGETFSSPSYKKRRKKQTVGSIRVESLYVFNMENGGKVTAEMLTYKPVYIY